MFIALLLEPGPPICKGVVGLLFQGPTRPGSLSSVWLSRPEPSVAGREGLVQLKYFSALHGMSARTSDEKGVCLSVGPSVRLSVKRVDCDKTDVSRFLYHTKDHLT